MTFTTTELVGYIGSIIILISFLMKQIKTLRILNTVGCGIFVVYGILLSFNIPIILTNGVIIIINLYYLKKNK